MTVQHEKSSEWEKENIKLYANEAADREFTRVAAECASDSDLLRQSVRYTEQLVHDVATGRSIHVQRRDGINFPVKIDMFKDSDISVDAAIIRRSLVLHKASRPRLDNLQKELGLEDISAVARFALRFFFLIAKEARNGARFFVTENGKSTEVRFGSLTPSQGALTSDSKTEFEDESSPLPQPGGVTSLPKRPRAITSNKAAASLIAFGHKFGKS